VAKAHRLSVKEMDNPRRDQRLAAPRHIAMYIAAELTDCSLPHIAREFGKKDHTTVMYARDKVKDIMGAMKPTATKSARSSRSAKRSQWGDRNEPARSECRAKLNNKGTTSAAQSLARKGRSRSTRGHKRIRKIKQQSLRDRTASSHRQGTRHNSLDLRESLADISHLNPFDHPACLRTHRPRA